MQGGNHSPRGSLFEEYPSRINYHFAFRDDDNRTTLDDAIQLNEADFERTLRLSDLSDRNAVPDCLFLLGQRGVCPGKVVPTVGQYLRKVKSAASFPEQPLHKVATDTWNYSFYPTELAQQEPPKEVNAAMCTHMKYVTKSDPPSVSPFLPVPLYFPLCILHTPQ